MGGPTQLPGAGSGLELFTDLDISGDFAYVAYNAGFGIWSLAGASSAAKPRRGVVKDGFRGQFCSFEQSHGEAEGIIWDIAFVADGDQEMIALAGAGSQVGLTLWNVTNKSNPRQLYQDKTRIGRRVEAIRFRNQAFAFVGALQGPIPGGLHVYNMSAAAECTATSANDCGAACPGVYLGEIKNWREVGYLSLLNRTVNGSEKLFVAVSDGPKTLTLGLQIREVTDLRSGTLASRRVFSGRGPRARGLALFEYRGKAYLAVKENVALKIFDVTACLDSGDCSALGSDDVVWSENIGVVGTKEELVTFTQADDDHPFLYFGNDSTCLGGAKKERLLDLRNLGTATPKLPELTDGGGTYADPGHGRTVDYWGTYYDQNTGGFNRVAPRRVKVRREPSDGKLYFYRVAWTLFDVHMLDQPDDEIFKDGFESGDHSGWSTKIGLRGDLTSGEG